MSGYHEKRFHEEMHHQYLYSSAELELGPVEGPDRWRRGASRACGFAQAPDRGQVGA
jgi:hypothetical protein